MSLIFSAHGDAVTLTNYSIKYSRQMAQFDASQSIANQRGASFLYYGQRDGSQEIRVKGIVKSTTGALLDTAIDSLLEILDSADILLEDTERDRFAIVEKSRFNRVFVPPYLYQVELDLVIVDGVWFDDLDDAPSVTSATVASTKLVRYVNITYNGTGTMRPRILCALNIAGGGTNWDAPKIEWRGTNLFKNSSFEDGADTPTNWYEGSVASAANPPTYNLHYGRVGSKSIRASRDGGTYRYIGSGNTGAVTTTAIEVDAGTIYVASIYARKVTTAVNVTIKVLYYDASGTAISNVFGTFSESSGAWTRHEYNFTTPVTCAYVIVEFSCVTDGLTLDLDDAQLEKGSTATEFVNTSDDQWKHVSFERTTGVTTTTANGPDLIAIDMDLGRARNARTQATISDWEEDNSNMNAYYFDLHPGLNQLYVSAPNAGDVPVDVNVPALYF